MLLGLEEGAAEGGFGGCGERDPRWGRAPGLVDSWRARGGWAGVQHAFFNLALSPSPTHLPLLWKPLPLKCNYYYCMLASFFGGGRPDVLIPSPPPDLFYVIFGVGEGWGGGERVCGGWAGGVDLPRLMAGEEAFAHINATKQPL